MIDYLKTLGGVTFELNKLDPHTYGFSRTSDIAEGRDALTKAPVVRALGIRADTIDLAGVIDMTQTPTEVAKVLNLMNTLMSYVGTEQTVTWLYDIRSPEIWLVESVEVDQAVPFGGLSGQGKVWQWSMSMTYVKEVPTNIGGTG